VWTIWNSRNDVCFSERTFSAECLVDRVKLLSWKWFLGKNPDISCSFYEWGMQPFSAGIGRVWRGVQPGPREILWVGCLLCLSSFEFVSCLPLWGVWIFLWREVRGDYFLLISCFFFCLCCLRLLDSECIPGTSCFLVFIFVLCSFLTIYI
jgi:hypothetical protein